MGRKSVKENKSVYQLARENQGLTREKASDLMAGLPAERIEKIENGRSNIYPEDVILMAQHYKAPGLCNYYCSHECAIGQNYIPEVKSKALAQITIETLSALNKLNREKDRLLEIVEDGQITPDEYEDFLTIKTTLDKISLAVDALQLWVDEAIAAGSIDKSFKF